MSSSTKAVLFVCLLLVGALVAVGVHVRGSAGLWLPPKIREWTCPHGPYASACELNKELVAKGIVLMMPVDEALDRLKGAALLQRASGGRPGFDSDSLGLSFGFAPETDPALPGRVVEIGFSGVGESVFGLGIGSSRAAVEAKMESRGYGKPELFGLLQRYRKDRMVLTFEFEDGRLKRVAIELGNAPVPRSAKR